MTHDDKTLIRLKDYKNDFLICSFKTSIPEHYIALYNYCKENEIAIYLPSFEEEKIDKAYKNITDCFIQDIIVIFGSKNCFPAIDIYVNCYC